MIGRTIIFCYINPMSQTTIKICDKIILISFYFLFIIVPLILTPWNYELFEYNKMMVVYGLTIIIMASWLVKMVSQKELKISRTPFDLPILAFLASQILSTIFSLDRHISLWGYYSRFHGGLLSTISYVFLYYAFVSNVSLSHLGNLIKVTLGTASLVAFYGILEHFGIDKNLWVQDVQNRVFSTLGQPNWLAAYVAVLIPITLGVGLQTIDDRKLRIDKKNLSSLSILIIIFAFYLVLLYTKSRSGLLGFWIANIIFWGIILFICHSERVKRVEESLSTVSRVKDPSTSVGMTLILLLISNLSFLLISFLIGGSGLGPLEKFSFPQLYQNLTRTSPTTPTSLKPSGLSALESGVTESGNIRKIVWQGAWDIFKNNPLFGTGVETFAFSYYKYRPVAHNQTSEWDFLYNKAHNEFLNYLATTGIVGFGSWMWFIFAYIWWVAKTFFKDNKINFLLIGLFAGWTSILITDFFGFSVVIVALLFFLIPAISFVLSEKEQTKAWLIFRLSFSRRVQIGFVSLIGLINLIGLISLLQIWRADTFFASGYKLNRAGQVTVAYEKLARALELNPNEPFYHDEFSYSLATLAQAAYEQKEATLSSIFSQQAVAESDSAIKAEPNNLNFYKTRTRVFYALSRLDPKYNTDALEAIYNAAKLAPTEPKIHYNLAILYGRMGQIDLAIKTLRETIKLKPDYRDPYFALALILKDQNNQEEAKQNLEFILKNLNPQDLEVKNKLEEWEK